MSASENTELAAELVDDRALESAAQDQFAHVDFAGELADLVTSVPPPANVALFAPWGAGKTGLGNLLYDQLDSRVGVRFARFDAFKFAEFPLRRQFISQVAKELRIDDPRFRKGLYRSRGERVFEFPADKWQPLVKRMAIAAAVVACSLFVIVATITGIVALAHHKSYLNDLWIAFKSYLVPGFSVSALLGAIGAVGKDGFSVDYAQDMPFSEEQFEEAFEELVKKAINASKNERLVIFIDELDRCSSSEVVTTLETMKTFLAVKGCVFVVAADLQVLEQALRESARQQTPENELNPYYSSGSAYLDKIFQYQLALPPLKPRSLTTFALGLVKDKPGVWSEIPNLADAVSVLIPTHVSSPRRVKILLNSYLMTYRLAKRRASSGRLHDSVSGRAEEIAKLVCLRCEFPLFAAEIPAHPTLPDLVRRIADGETLADDVRDRELALSFASGERPVSELLVDEEDGAGSPVVQDEGSDGDRDELAARETPIQYEFGQQLRRYLQKTSFIDGPSRDLMFLQSAAIDVDLDAGIADELELAALDNDLNHVLEVVTGLDEAQKLEAIRLLIRVVGEEKPGEDGRNAVSILLQTISRTGIDTTKIADSAAYAIAVHGQEFELRDTDLAGALKLALSAKRGRINTLRDRILEQDTAISRPDVGLVLVNHVHAVPKLYNAELGAAATAAFLGRGDDFIASLTSLTDSDASRVLERMAKDVRAAEDGSSTDDDSQINFQEHYQDLLRSCLKTERSTLGDAALSMLLTVSSAKALQAIMAERSGLPPIESGKTVSAMLAELTRWPPTSWPNWLGMLAPSSASKSSDAAGLVDQAAARLWVRMTDANEAVTGDELEAALKSLSVFRAADTPADGQKLTEAIESSLAGPVSDSAVLSSQQTLLSRARVFSEHGFIDRQAVEAINLRSCAETLRLPPQPVPVSTPNLPAEIYARVRAGLNVADAEPLAEIGAAVTASQWLPEPLKANLAILVAAELQSTDDSIVSPQSPETVAEFVTQFGEAYDDGLIAWLRAFAQAAPDIWTATQTLARRPMSEALELALRNRTQRLSAEARYDLAAHVLDSLPTERPTTEYLRAIRISEADRTKTWAHLLSTAERAETREDYENILSVAAKIGTPTAAVATELLISVVVPLINTGPGGVDAALESFGVVGSSTKHREAVEALRTHADGSEQQRRVDDTLKEAGWRKQSLFSKPRDVLGSDDE